MTFTKHDTDNIRNVVTFLSEPNSRESNGWKRVGKFGRIWFRLPSLLHIWRDTLRGRKKKKKREREKEKLTSMTQTKGGDLVYLLGDPGAMLALQISHEKGTILVTDTSMPF